MKEEFSDDIVNIVANSLNKVSRGGIGLVDHYSFSSCRVIYGIKDDVNKVGRVNDFSFYNVVELEVVQSFHKRFLRTCKEEGKLLDHMLFVRATLLSVFFNSVLKSDQNDIMFQIGIEGKFDNKNPVEIRNKDFSLPFIFVRYVRKPVSNRGFFANDRWKEGLDDLFIKEIEKHGGAFMIMKLGDFSNVIVPHNDLVRYWVNYM